jgi:hypothetical protein
MLILKYSDSRIMAIHKQYEEGVPVLVSCSEHGTSLAQLRAKFGGMNTPMVRRLKELEDENRPDNGPEYVSQALVSWANDNTITLMYIQPGKSHSGCLCRGV